MKHYKLFQAWQNQSKEYTDFLTKALQKIKERQRNKGIDIEIIRFPAQEQAGSPDIVNMVWEQISDCDLFVGDLTEISKVDFRSISNPNVMYEVGIADAVLGEKRVILVCSKDTCVSELAFDINHKRISPLGVDNPNAISLLEKWIEAGIVECDIQNLHRDFILQPLYDDLYVVYNNLMRMVYTNDYEYSEGVLPPTQENIKLKLQDAVLNELMVSVDYSCIISRLKNEIKSLYEANIRRFLSYIIKIYNDLDKYNWFIHTVQKQVAFIETDIKAEYLLQNTRAFYIKDISGVDEFYGSILFGEKYVYINGEQSFQNVFLKEMLTDSIRRLCNIQNITLDNGALTGMKMRTYKLTDESLDFYSKYIHAVIASIYEFMDGMNFQPTNHISDIKCNTIITWKK